MNYDFLFKAIVAFASLLGIVVTLRKGFLLYRRWWSGRLVKWSNFFGGNWNNQGQIKNKPSHYIDLDGWGGGKEFEGRFNVRRADDENSWEMFKIIGKRSSKKLKCKVIRVQNGEESHIASGVLKKNDNFLEWNLVEDSSTLFPIEAVLRRGLPKLI